MKLNHIKRLIFSSPKKQINLFKVYLSYFLKRPKIFGAPIRLMVEPANFCNLHCATCPVGAGEIKKEKGVMKFSDFKKIIDEVGGYLYHLTLWNWGEPFLNKELAKMIKYARDKKIHIVTSTNGHFLDSEKIAKEIVESGLNELIIALDGLSQETLEQYRKGADFKKVVEGIKLMVKIKKELKAESPVIKLQFIVMKHNEHEISKLKSFAKELGVEKVTIKTFGSHLDISKLENFEPNKKSFSRYKKNIKKGNGCKKIWIGMNINYDGNVVPCCYDPLESHVIGNIHNDSVLKIWNSSEFINFRKLALNNKKSLGICKNCNFNHNISIEVNINN